MEPTATATRTEQPKTDSIVTADAVEEHLSALRKIAKSDKRSAQEQAWAWLEDLGAAHDEAALDALFELGKPSKGLEGQTKGMLVTFTMQPQFDRVVRMITGAWMPWLGKRFDSKNASGDNLLAKSARWPAKLLWPRYGTKDGPDSRAAFDFETAIEKSRSSSDVKALKIDYGPIESNPGLIIRKIRDELVELVPGTHLGKMLWRRDEEPYPCLAYFALRQPVD